MTSNPPRVIYDARIADLAFAILNEYRVRNNFIAEDHQRHFPALVHDLATRIQEAVTEYIEDEIASL